MADMVICFTIDSLVLKDAIFLDNKYDSKLP